MQRLILIIALMVILNYLNAQSDALVKGQNGFEINIGQAFLEGKNTNLVNLGGSINGRIDLGFGLAAVSTMNQYVFGAAYHFGGEPNEMGASIDCGYVLFPDFDNYFLIGPTVYANQVIGNIILIPSFSFKFATTEVFDFAGSFGLGFFTKGQVGLSFRPQFVFTSNQTYFSIQIGLLAHS